MVIDCHMHYDPTFYPLDRMLAGMDANGIDKTALIGVMVEPFPLYQKMRQASGAVMRHSLMHANAVGRIMYGSTLKRSGHFFLMGSRYRIYDRIDNSAVAAAVAAHPDRFMGWIFVNPAVSDPMEEIERWTAAPGMIGVKAHPFWHRYPVSKLEGAAAWCRDAGYPMLIHLGTGANGDYRLLPDRFPGLKVIYAHAGIPYYRRLWPYVKEHPGVHVDLSSPYLDAALVRQAVNALGVDKCLYGTDGPYGHQLPGEEYDYGWIKSWLTALPLKSGERERLLGGNILSLIQR